MRPALGLVARVALFGVFLGVPVSGLPGQTTPARGEPITIEPRYLASGVSAQDAPADDPNPLLGPPIAQHGGAIRAIVADPEPGADRLWIGHGPRVEAIDVSDPSAPRVSMTGPLLEDVVTDIAVEGDRLAVAAGPWLYSLGIRPDGLEILGRLELGGSIASIESHQGRAYMRSPSDFGRLLVVDMRDPNRLQGIELPDLLDAGDGITDLLVRGNRIYVSVARSFWAEIGQRGSALLVFDLADPDRPRRLARLEDEAWGALSSPSDGKDTPIVYGYAEGVIAMDLEDPLQLLTLVRWSRAPRGFRLNPYAANMAVDATGRPYVSKAPAFANGALWIPDSEDAAEDWLDLFVTSVYITAVGAFGPHLAVAEDGGRIQIVEPIGGDPGVSGPLPGATLDLIGATDGLAFDPASPRHLVASMHGGLGALEIGGDGKLERLGTAYDGHNHWGLSVADRVVALHDAGADDWGDSRWDLYDLRDPARPRKASGTDDEMHSYSGQHVRRGPIMLQSEEFGRDIVGDAIGIWNVADPDAPRRLAQWHMPRLLTSFDVDGDLLVAARIEGRNDGETHPLILELADISQPETPQHLGSVDTGLVDRTAGRHFPVIRVSGRHVFVMSANWHEAETDEDVIGLMYILDLERPESPMLATLPFEEGLVSIVDIVGDYVFTEQHVIDVREVSAPKVIAELPHGYIRAVDPVHGRLFASDGPGGIWVYEPDLDWPAIPAPATYTPAPTLTPSATASPRPTVTPTPSNSPPAPRWEILMPVIGR